MVEKHNCWHCEDGVLVQNTKDSPWVICDSCDKKQHKKVAKRQNDIRDLAYSDLAISKEAQLLLDIQVPEGIDWEENKYHWLKEDGK